MIYYCPQCKKELKKGPYAGWVRWFIGPLFGQLLRPLVCDEHGEIDPDTLSPEERSSVMTRRTIGILLGGAVNIAILILIILSYE